MEKNLILEINRIHQLMGVTSKSEILIEHCEKNNIAVDLPSDKTLSLIDEYKLKLETLKKEFE